MTAVCTSKQVVLTILTLAVGLGVSLAAAQAADFEAIKAAATREGKVVVWHNTPNQKTTDALAALFNARFGMNIKVERVSVSGSDMTSRMMTEKRGGRVTVDVFVGTDRHLPQLVKNNLIEKVDWVETFAGPGKLDTALMESAANNMIPAFIGYGLEFRHSVYGVVYNTKLLSESDIPTTWEGLTEPKWRNKVVIDVGLSPLARLVPVIGKEATLALAKKYVANRPIFADGQPAAASKVSTGEAPLGVLSWSSGLDEMNKGAPIGLVFLEPQALLSQAVVYVAKGAPHPNLAQLWAAWMTSEGMTTQPMIDEGILRAWPNSPGPFGAYFAKHNLTARRASSMEELDIANNIRKDLDKIAAGR